MASIQTRGLAPEAWERRLFIPAYSVGEAARYAGVHPSTVAYWHYHQTRGKVTLPGKERRRPLSYYQLVEVAFVATFRKLGVSLGKIRYAHDFWGKHLHVEFPFAQYEFYTDGAGMLFDLR